MFQAVAHEIIQQFCHQWKIQTLSIFGSATREDFSVGSDSDLLVTFAEDAKWGLLDHLQMERELKEIFGRDVDLISRRAIEQSQNWIRRKTILESAQVLFSASEGAHEPR